MHSCCCVIKCNNDIAILLGKHHLHCRCLYEPNTTHHPAFTAHAYATRLYTVSRKTTPACAQGAQVNAAYKQHHQLCFIRALNVTNITKGKETSGCRPAVDAPLV